MKQEQEIIAFELFSAINQSTRSRFGFGLTNMVEAEGSTKGRFSETVLSMVLIKHFFVIIRDIII